MVVMRVGGGGGLGEGGGGGVLAGSMGWGAWIGDPGADGCGVGLVFEGPGVGYRGTGVGRRDEGLVRGAEVGIGGSGMHLGFSGVWSPTRSFVLVGHDLVQLRPCLWCRPSLGCLTR